MISCTTGRSLRARHRVPLRGGVSALVVFACASLAPVSAAAAQGGSSRAPTPPPVAPRLDTLTVADIVRRLQASSTQSPALAASRANRDVAHARAAAAGFAAPAVLSAGLAEAPYAHLDQGNLRLEVGRELFTGPRRRAERGVAEAEVRSADAALAAAERQASAAVLRDAIRTAGARVIAARLAAEDALLAGAEDGVRARFAVGGARYVDVLRLRTERLRVQSEQAATLADARVAFATLSGTLGTTPESRPSLAAALDSLGTPALADAWRLVLPATAITEVEIEAFISASAEVQQATAAVARSEAEDELAAATRRRQVEGFAGVQRIGQAENGPTLGPSVSVTVSLPFTASRANRLGAAAGEQSIRAAGFTRSAAITAARARVQAAAERYAAAREQLAVFDAALLRGARDERESALASYRTGSLTLLELVDFERALARAEIARIRALVDAVDAWADLVGGGSSDEGDAAHTMNASDAR